MDGMLLKALSVGGIVLFAAACERGRELAPLPFGDALKPGLSALRSPAAGPLSGKTFLTQGWLLQDVPAVAEPGEVVSSGDFAPSQWMRATVPGTVLTSLVNEGLYEEPLWGLHNLEIPESLNTKQYWYRVSFDLPPAYRGKAVWLHLDGINYEAEIWLNGALLGRMKGAFGRDRFNITALARGDNQNHLAVKITPPPHPGIPHEQTLTDFGQNGGILSLDSPTFLSSMGWDWMPAIRDRNIGIWQEVYLTATNPVAIENPRVITDLPLPDTSRADITVEAELTNPSAVAQRGVLSGHIEGIAFQQEVALAAFESRRVTFDRNAYPQLSIPNPRLWWPNGYGRPELYVLELAFVNEGGTSAEERVRFGIREISYEVPEGGPVENSFPPKSARHVRVVGTKRGTRGGISLAEFEVFGAKTGSTNLARNRPASASSSVDDLGAPNAFDGQPETRWASAARDLEWVGVDLGVSTLIDRVRLDWDRAYAKEYKIQVSADAKKWDDVLYGNPPEMKLLVNGQKIFCKGGNWGMDEAMKRNPREKLEAEIRLHREANFTMIRNWVGQTDDEDFYDLCDENGILVFDEFWLAHPRNRPDPADPALFLKNARDKILRYRNHPSVALWCGRNEGFPPEDLSQGLAQLVTELDGTRRYQDASIYLGMHGEGPYKYMPPEYYFKGRAHGFSSEIGTPSIPTTESIQAMMPKADWWPPTNTWGYHDFSGDCVNYQGVLARRYGAATGLADFVRKAQLINYESHRAIFESWNHVLWHDGNGTLLWMSHPAQPSFMWQIYDYYLETNASFFGSKKGCEPLHVQMNLDDLGVTVVNTTLEPRDNLVVTARIYGLDGVLKLERAAPVSAPANQFKNCFTLALPPDLSRVYFVKLELRDQAQRVLSENFYWRSLDETDYTQLDTLPRVTLGGSAALLTDEDALTLQATLHNPSAAVALAIRLKLQKSTAATRVLPVYYQDNYFSLLPGETRQVKLDFHRRDLGGEEPRLLVEGWNITPAEIPIR